MGHILNKKIHNDFIQVFSNKTNLLLELLSEKLTINEITDISSLVCRCIVDSACGKYTNNYSLQLLEIKIHFSEGLIGEKLNNSQLTNLIEALHKYTINNFQIVPSRGLRFLYVS